MTFYIFLHALNHKFEQNLSLSHFQPLLSFYCFSKVQLLLTEPQWLYAGYFHLFLRFKNVYSHLQSGLSQLHVSCGINPGWTNTVYCAVSAGHDVLFLLMPTQHAYALELLHDQLYEGAKALDVGSGSGILSVCFARMVSHTRDG